MDDKSLNIQKLRADASRFFADLKGRFGALDQDLAVVDRELKTVEEMQEKVATDIKNIEERAMERMEKELVNLLNEADEENEYEMGMG
jgi:predicted  nucleic acid-binding Zn-ribbon protein